MDLLKIFCIERMTRLAFTGSGGKTTVMFQLARTIEGGAVITSTTHLACEQCQWADYHYTINCSEDLNSLQFPVLNGIHLFTGGIEKNRNGIPGWNSECRTKGLDPQTIADLKEIADSARVPMLIEADGSRQKPLKAPAEHEPVIPEWVDNVVYVVGLKGLDKPLTKKYVHRPELFGKIADLNFGERVTINSLLKVILSKNGGRKGIPPNAYKVLLINQADNTLRQSKAFRMADSAKSVFDRIIISNFPCKQSNTIPFKEENENGVHVHSVIQPIAGIILAAGLSKRYGSPKVLLPFRGKPFLRHIAETAIMTGLYPVVIIAGSEIDRISKTVEDLPVMVAINQRWAQGQGTSVSEGIKNLPDKIGGAVFLLSDQPQITPTIIDTLIQTHRTTQKPIIVPVIDAKRANPVLFGKECFSKMAELDGDVGGRSLFNHFPVHEVPWYDTSMLQDVDTQSDYQELLKME